MICSNNMLALTVCGLFWNYKVPLSNFVSLAHLIV